MPMFNLNDEALPEGWKIEDEAELHGDLTWGYCPKHGLEMLGQ